VKTKGGFRKGYSTTDNLFVIYMLISIMKNKKKKLYCAFIDFAKAFDSVWRKGLWHKLLGNEINGKMYKVIFKPHTFLSSRNCWRSFKYIENKKGKGFLLVELLYYIENIPTFRHYIKHEI
jgi:hypothetical protein